MQGNRRRLNSELVCQNCTTLYGMKHIQEQNKVMYSWEKGRLLSWCIRSHEEVLDFIVLYYHRKKKTPPPPAGT